MDKVSSNEHNSAGSEERPFGSTLLSRNLKKEMVNRERSDPQDKKIKKMDTNNQNRPVPEENCCEFFTGTNLQCNDDNTVITEWHNLDGVYSKPEALLERLHDLGAHKTGICKVIPPQQWKHQVLKDLVLPAEKFNILQQSIEKSEQNGVYFVCCNNAKKKIKMTYDQFCQKNEKNKESTCSPDDRRQIEQEFWKCTEEEVCNGLYGADIDMSLMHHDLEGLNFTNFHSFLNVILPTKINGIHTPYVYFGSPNTFFGVHLEDGNTHSLNFCYFGWKLWYGVYLEDKLRFEAVMRAHFQKDWETCQNPLRHKTFLPSTKFLRDHCIRYVSIIQEPGDLIITFPGGYHFGGNLVMNCCEAIGALTKCGMKYVSIADHCTCSKQALSFDIKEAVKKYTPELYYQWGEIQEGRDIDINKNPFRIKRTEIQQFKSIEEKEIHQNSQRILKSKRPRKIRKNEMMKIEDHDHQIEKLLRWLLSHQPIPLYQCSTYKKAKKCLGCFKTTTDKTLQRIMREKLMKIKAEEETYNLTDEEIEELIKLMNKVARKK